jgi:tripartite-type tricarboxylate transporter receptor subunit TctC
MVLLKWIVLLITFGIGGAGGVAAQGYPNKPIRMVVPFPPGGGADVVARILSQKFSESLGQQAVVDNRSGAAGNIGAEIVATSAADGYTLLFTNNTIVINAGLPGKQLFDVVKDFAPVALSAVTAVVLGVHPSVKANSVEELIALAKAEPGKLSYSSCGNGTALHLAGEMLKQLAQIDMLHVPYRGCAPALADTLGGQVPVMFSTISNVAPHHNAGKLRILALASARRSDAYPRIPTIAEAGIAGYDADVWSGILAPARTPKEVVARLNAEANRIVGLSDVQERFRSQFYEPRTGTPEQFGTQIRSDVIKWSKLIKEAGIQGD